MNVIIPNWLLDKAERYNIRRIRPVITADSSGDSFSVVWQWLTKRGWKEVKK